MIHIKLYYGYINMYTIDANKHPDEQVKDLYVLLKQCKEESNLKIYCNSPYILNELVIIEGYTHEHVPHPEGFEVTTKHFEILKDGQIVEGEYYKSMVSDENLLNSKLGETNDRYSDMLELSQELERKNYE
ncbi:MAG: hypothetical protein ACOH2V_01040 [Candidatus Saccharimonadaceae bacterium]